MYPPNHKAGPSKQESFRVFGGFEDPDPFRMKSTQLPTPPSRLHFTFTPEPQQKPTRRGNEQDKKTSVSIAATEIQDPSDLKKGYGFEYPEESAEESVDIFLNESSSKPRGFTWVGSRKPEGHFEKVLQETRPDPLAESQPTTTHGIEHNHTHRPKAIPRRTRKPETNVPIFCLPGDNTILKSCQNGPYSSVRVDFSKPPAPSVEDVEDEEEETRNYVERKPVSSHHDHNGSQTTKSVLPSPLPTPPPQAVPSTSTKPTRQSAAATTDNQLYEGDMASSNDSDTDSDDESDLEVSRLHSWNWPVVSKSGNFEVRSPTPSPAAKKRQSSARSSRMRTESPVAPPPSHSASLSLAQMKLMATVPPVETTAQPLTPCPAQKKWKPPRFAHRQGDSLTRELALTLGRLGLAENKSKGKGAER